MACFDIENVAGQYAELYREALGWQIKAERIETDYNGFGGGSIIY